MSETIEILKVAAKTLPNAIEMYGRTCSLEIAATSNNEDPAGLRRVRTALASKGGAFQGDWLLRVVPCPGWDPPMPKLGDSLSTAYYQGNPHDGAYLGSVHNDTNPPFEKKDPFKDDWRVIPGDSTFLVGKSQIYGVEVNLDIAIGETRSATIGKDDLLEVEGRSRISIEGKQVIQVEADRVLAVKDKSTHRGGTTVVEADGEVTIRNGVGSEINLKKTGQILLKSADGSILALGKLPLPPRPLPPLDLSLEPTNGHSTEHYE